MTQFWLYAALLCAVAAGVVAWPRRRRAAVDREGVNVALYRQRLDELVREHREVIEPHLMTGNQREILPRGRARRRASVMG